MRLRNLLLIGALAGAAACGRESGVTSSEGVPADLSAGRSVLVDGVTFTESLTFYEGVVGGEVRGWATPAGSGGLPYSMGTVHANGGEASYLVERPGYQGRLEAVAYAPRCHFRRWVIGLNIYHSSPAIYIGDYRGLNSFIAEFVCAPA